MRSERRSHPRIVVGGQSPVRYPIIVCLMAALLMGSRSSANELDDARALFRSGEYDEAIAAAKVQVEKKVWNEAWPRLLVNGYMVKGEYEQALAVYEGAIGRFGDSLRFRLLGANVYQFNNDPIRRERELEQIAELLQRAPWRYSNRNDLVPMGEYFLLRGEDPKQVLKICYDQAVKLDPKNAEAHLAIARMALAKNDAQVAAQSLEKALALQGEDEDPEVFYLAARVWQDTERGQKEDYLARALERNPKHVPSLLAAAESSMDSERFDAAASLLVQVAEVNPRHPRMWALRAVLAHLLGDFPAEGTARRTALETWKLNPEVDHVIGKQLSLHYRFEEGAEYQRRALSMDANYTPARTQLAQDLLRLGQTDEGWILVDGIRQSDPYDVSIFNLKQLQAKLEQFATLESEGFVVRMDSVEAEVYGEEVLALLAEARNTMVQKYQVALREPIFVEIFPRQQEFAIRTFGLPGGSGFLGVCFGRLITANSPAALRVDSNWRSVLWHEYCHVVTLQKTKNKMPRWLSEGISVYEERQRDAAWGERLDPVYREMMLSDDLVPISQLSGAFLQPKSPLHLQFAYYTSSLAVEFWIERWGMKGLLRLLDDLGVGMRPEEALARLPGSLEALDADFLEFARRKAEQMSDTADFERPSREGAIDGSEWLAAHPNSYWGLKQRLNDQLAAKDWTDALDTAKRLRELWPQDHAEDGIHAILAKIHRELGDEDQEREQLVALCRTSSAPREGLLRLIEIDRQRRDPRSMLVWCDRLIGIAPMNSAMQSWRSEAAEEIGDAAQAASALRAVAAMTPIDPAATHFRLARALLALGQPERAKRHCLQALEESPSYLDALKLLVQMQPVDGP